MILMKKKACFVADECRPTFVYKREEWVHQYLHMVMSDDTCTVMDEDGQQLLSGWVCMYACATQYSTDILNTLKHL